MHSASASDDAPHLDFVSCTIEIDEVDIKEEIKSEIESEAEVDVIDILHDSSSTKKKTSFLEERPYRYEISERDCYPSPYLLHCPACDMSFRGGMRRFHFLKEHIAARHKEKKNEIQNRIATRYWKTCLRKF